MNILLRQKVMRKDLRYLYLCMITECIIKLLAQLVFSFHLL